MAKASQKAPAATSLGTKRTCPKCSTKFYDFGRPEILCPKCEAKIDPAAAAVAPTPEPVKKPKPSVKGVPEDAFMETEDVEVASTDDFESVEDLDDDDAVEEIDTEGKDDGDNY